MARSISWQRDLRTIHRRVAESAQTAYTRAHLETLFDLGPSAAQKILELMPRQLVGTSIIVAREDLLEWIHACTDAEDLSIHIQQLRADPPKPSRRKLRVRVPRAVEEGRISGLKKMEIFIERGKMTVYFSNLDDFASKMLQAGEAMLTAEFERRFCEPPPPRPVNLQAAAQTADVAFLKVEKQFTESILAGEKSSAAGDRKLTTKLYNRAREAFAEMQRIAADSGIELDEVYTRAYAALTVCDDVS